MKSKDRGTLLISFNCYKEDKYKLYSLIHINILNRINCHQYKWPIQGLLSLEVMLPVGGNNCHYISQKLHIIVK